MRVDVTESLRRLSVAQDKSECDVIYSVDMVGNTIDVYGEQEGKYRHVRVTFNNSGTIFHVAEEV